MRRAARLLLAFLLAFAAPFSALAQSAQEDRQAQAGALEQLRALVPGFQLQIPGFGAQQHPDLGLTPQELLRIGSVAKIIKEQWYKDVESQKLMRGALRGMFKELDPHSVYFDPEEFKKFNEHLTGSFVGIGAGLQPKEEGGPVVILYTFPNSPARRAGLQGGDAIVEVDGQNVGPMTLEEAVTKIRGPQGTTVSLTIARKDPATGKLKVLPPVTVSREAVTTSNVFSKVVNGTGYLYFNEFRGPSAQGAQDDTATVVAQHIRRLQAQGASSLIIDVRSNPGGSLHVVGQLTAMFLKKGQVVVMTRNRQGVSTKPPIVALKDGEFKDIPLKVLINGSSASASEILAGALKDHKRATIIGSRSYGKGTAQVVVPLKQVVPGWPDNDGIKLTVETWHTPTGGTIEKDPVAGTGGVTPDVEVKVDKELELKILQSILDQLNDAGAGTPVDDPVLQRALQP